MSLQYYIEQKKIYTQMLVELERSYYSNPANVLFFSQKRDELNRLKLECEKKVHEQCIHDFETDLIDIDPDRSITIQYCKICEYTKR